MSTKIPRQRRTYGRKKVTDDLTLCFGRLGLSSSDDRAEASEFQQTILPTLDESHSARARITTKASGKVVAPSIIPNSKPQSGQATTNGPDPVFPNRAGRPAKSQARSNLPSVSKPPLQLVNGNASKRASSRSKRIVPTQVRPNALELPAPLPYHNLDSLLQLPFIDDAIADFTGSADRWTESFLMTKLAHGSYASIYRFALRADPSIYTIWKFIPLKPQRGRGSRNDLATFVPDANAEVRLLEGMSKSPGFVEFRSARVLQGRMPPLLQRLHDQWQDQLRQSDRDALGDLGQDTFGPDQVWLVIEMSDAGMDLEALLKKRGADGQKRLDITEAWDIFWGCAEALAHGEQHAQFEHRDLHAGNICLRRRAVGTDEDGLIPRLTDWQVTLIDYTLSRACLPSEPDLVISNGMQPNLFEQHAETEADEAQYQAYRFMREIMHAGHKGAKRKTGFKTFMPTTNIVWLHFILGLLLHECRVADFEEGEETLEFATAHLTALLADICPKDRERWRYTSASELVEAEVHSTLLRDD